MATIAIEKDQPIVSFGLITDIHYADLEDRWNYSRTFLRRYRNSLKLVHEACQHWLNEKHSLAFVVQLGDLIDGFCTSNNSTENDLRTILKEFEKLPRVYHLWGNHEFYNLTRNQLLASPLCSFDTKEISPSHYGTIDICPNLRIIALDTYDLSLLGIDENTERYDQAMSTLRKYNQNENVNDRTGLDGYQQRFIQLNGGLTQKQLTWLRDQLLHARNHHDKVLVFGNALYMLSIERFSFFSRTYSRSSDSS